MFMFKLLKGAHVKSLILGFLILLGHNSALAYDFVVDGIYYNILSTTDLTCEVTYKSTDSENFYSGNIEIPTEVAYKNKILSVTGIGNYAFTRNEYLTSVKIPESIIDIGRAAFCNLKGITSLTIPSSVRNIYPDALAYCKNLTHITFEDGVETLFLEPAYNGKAEVSPFTLIGSGVSKICYLYIGRNLKAMPKSTFDVLVNLNILEIGKNVKEIGADNMNPVSFHSCNKLSNINLYCATPPKLNNSSWNSFFPTAAYTDAKVQVPKGTLERYLSDKEWSKFWNIEEGNWESTIILSLALSDSELTLDKGDKTKIEALIEPVTLNKNVSWSSSNPVVAIVDDKGNVEALSEGNAIITCVTTDGSNLSATCKITVNEESGIDTIISEICSDIIVYDLCGTLVFKGSLNDINLPKGIYIIRDGIKYYKVLL